MSPLLAEGAGERGGELHGLPGVWVRDARPRDSLDSRCVLSPSLPPFLSICCRRQPVETGGEEGCGVDVRPTSCLVLVVAPPGNLPDDRTFFFLVTADITYLVAKAST